MKDEDKCVVCDCELNDDNRAEWEDYCKDCEFEVFEFYGAVGPIEESEELAITAQRLIKESRLNTEARSPIENLSRVKKKESTI